MSDPFIDKEAEIFGRYFLSQAPEKVVIERYVRIVQQAGFALTDKERRLLNICLRFSWLTGLVDSGLSWSHPHSVFRKRLYLMFAILETSPAYAERFLPVRRSPLYIFVIGWTGLCAVFKGIAGLLFVKIAA